MFSVCWIGCATIGGVLTRVSGRFAADPGSSCIPGVMCWVAFDRALRLADKRSLSGPLDVWRQTRDEIRNDVFTNFWNDELKSFVQAKGTKDLDAAALLMPLMRFISPVDPMWLSTMKAIEDHLVEDTLVRRYEVECSQVDGLPGTEGSFTACSFWYVECLARAGELEKAQLLFEKLVGLRQPSRVVFRRAGCRRAASWKFPAGVHPSRADQRGKLSRPGSIGHKRCNVAVSKRRLRRGAPTPSYGRAPVYRSSLVFVSRDSRIRRQRNEYDCSQTASQGLTTIHIA